MVSASCAPHPLHNLRRKYIQDMAFPSEDAPRQGVKGTNRLHKIRAGVRRHCAQWGRRGLDCACQRPVWHAGRAALPLLWCGRCDRQELMKELMLNTSEASHGAKSHIATDERSLKFKVRQTHSHSLFRCGMRNNKRAFLSPAWLSCKDHSCSL